MQPSRTRLVCRAHNRFTPSVALWQHFVAPNPPLSHQQRLSSSATQTGQDDANSNTAHANDASPFAQAEPTSDTTKDVSSRPPTIRKPTTAKGNFHASKVDATIAKNLEAKKDKRNASLTEPDELLASARAAYKIAQDYKGVVVQPMLPPNPAKENQLPWCAKTQEERTLSGMNRLDLEIQRFYEYAKPSRFEKVARKHVIEQVRNHVKQQLPNYVLSVFGSEKTGVALALSDIDLRLVLKSQLQDPTITQFPPAPIKRRMGLEALNHLLNKNLRKNRAYLLPAIRYARYPLVSLQDRQSGLDVQIVLSNDTSVSRVIMQGYMEEYPYLRPVYYVVKTMLDVRGLSDVFRGGFGSYSLFMMLVASIKHRPHPRQDAAGALVNFFKFWRDLDTTKHGVSIEPTFFFNKTQQSVMRDKVRAQVKEGQVKPLPAYMLSLRDPADETNDLGRKGIAIKHVQATMRDLCEKLEASLKTNTRHSLLLPIVGHIYSLNLRRRQKLDTYGKQIADHLYSALSIKAKAIRDAETAGAEEAVQTDALSAQSEDEVNMEDEAMRLRQAKEQRDKQWRVLEDQRKEQLRLEAEQSSVPHAEHGEALASIQDGAQPAVEDGVQLAAEGEMQPVVEGEVQSAVEDGAQSAVEGDVQSAVKHEAQEKSGSVEEPKKE